jgi:ABC-2 type transport system permease protein
LIFLGIQVPIWLEEKATPVRYFVLVDQSGSLAPVIEAALEKARQRQVLDALREYALKNCRSAAALGQFNEANSQSVETFISHGGKEPYLERLRPLLKPDASPFQQPRRRFERAALPANINAEADLAALVRDLKPYLRGERHLETNGYQIELSAAILIPRHIQDQIVRPKAASARAPQTPTATKGVADDAIQYWSANVTDAKSGLREQIEQAVNAEIRRREYLARGMDAEAIAEVERTYAPFASLNPKKEAGHETVGTADVIKQWAPSAFVYLLWTSIFMIVQMLLTNIIEEKSNRIIEVLLSSVTPGELMMGKLFGIASVGLTMLCAWMLALFGILTWKSGGGSAIAGPILVVLKTSNLVPVFCLYFILGYLMYAAVILSLGSVCNTLKDAQSYMGVITMLLMVPLLTMGYIPTDPNGVVARVLSWIPIYTPFTMMNRANADPPLVDMIGTMLLLLAATAGALWMAGKIFRIGILRTGQPPKIVEMLRWIRVRGG